MSCPCDSYQLIIIDPCDDPLILWDIVADETATWTAEIEFNGRLKCPLSIEVANGFAVEMPNVLNENYLHEMRLYRSDGSLVGCYWIGGPQFRESIPCGSRIIDEAGNPIISEIGEHLITE